MKKILAVINATYVVAKRKPEKNRYRYECHDIANSKQMNFEVEFSKRNKVCDLSPEKKFKNYWTSSTLPSTNIEHYQLEKQHTQTEY